MENDDLMNLRDAIEKYDKARNTRREYEHRAFIIANNPNAPICIRCKNYYQNGFLFECPIYALPEDGKVVGMYGTVYYSRQGHKPKTYPNTPMKSEDCDAFDPL